MSDTMHRPDKQALFDIASEQMGYFTADQAAGTGYAPYLLTYHTRRGTFQRVHRGVYRFRDYPTSPHEELAAAWLAVGKDGAVVSHESALDLWDLSDVVPNAMHFMVPRAQRSLAKRPPPGIIVHTSTRPWEHGDIQKAQGIRVTSPERTILDAAESGTQPEQVEIAISQAVARGWLNAGQLRHKASVRGRRVANLVARALAPQAA